ncbi:MAG: hypothetical protein J6E38_08640 [Clostridia bacterium]|nr:hypothetical protein [Clostridia bacterium]
MTNNNNIAETIRQALAEVRSMADSQTIIGDPIVVGETTLIPVSKVSIGVGLGGGTYGKDTNNNAGAGGTGLTVSPVAFIVISKNGTPTLLNVGSEFASPKIAGTVNEIDKALDDVPEIISKVKGIFKKDKKETETVVTEEVTVTEETVTE